MVHDSCHVWNGWGHTDLIKSPTCQPPIPSQRMCFLSTLAVSAIGLTVQLLLGSLGLRGTPISSYLLRMNFFFLFPCSSSVELVTEHVSTIACPVQCRVVHRGGDSSREDTVWFWVMAFEVGLQHQSGHWWRCF